MQSIKNLTACAACLHKHLRFQGALTGNCTAGSARQHATGVCAAVEPAAAPGGRLLSNPARALSPAGAAERAAARAGQRTGEHELARTARATAEVRLGLRQLGDPGALLEPPSTAPSEAGEPWVARQQAGPGSDAPPARLRMLASPAPGSQGCGAALGRGPPSCGSSGGPSGSGGWGTPAEPYSEPYSCAASDAGTLWGPRSPAQNLRASAARHHERLAGFEPDSLCQVWSPAAAAVGGAPLAKPGSSGGASESPCSAGDEAASPDRQPCGDRSTGRRRLSLLEALQAPPGSGPIEVDTVLLYSGGDGSATSSLPGSPRIHPGLPGFPTSLRPASLLTSAPPGSALTGSPHGSPNESHVDPASLPCSPAAEERANAGLQPPGSALAENGPGQAQVGDSDDLASAPAAESPVPCDHGRSTETWGLGSNIAEAGAPAMGRGSGPALARLRLDASGDTDAHAELLDALAAAFCEPCTDLPGLDGQGSANPSGEAAAAALAWESPPESPAVDAFLGVDAAHGVGEAERRASGAAAGPSGQGLGIRERIARLRASSTRAVRRPPSAQPWPLYPGARLSSSSCTPGGGAGGACGAEASSGLGSGAQDDSGEACRGAQPGLPKQGPRLRSSSCMPAGAAGGACSAGGSVLLHPEAGGRGSDSCGQSPAAGLPGLAQAAEVQLHVSPADKQEPCPDPGLAAMRRPAQDGLSMEEEMPPTEGARSAKQAFQEVCRAPKQVHAVSHGGKRQDAGAARQAPRSASAPRERPGRHVTRPQCAPKTSNLF